MVAEAWKTSYCPSIAPVALSIVTVRSISDSMPLESTAAAKPWSSGAIS